MSFGRRYEGKVCLVTASTAGIGYAIAARLAQEGGKVVISARRQEGIDAALENLRKLDGVKATDVVGKVCDFGIKEHRVELLEFTKSHFGTIDALISNAAVNTFFGPTLETPEASFDSMFDVNVRATFLFVQESLPFLTAGVYPTRPSQFAPNILLVGSVAAYGPFAPIGVYGITKTTMLGLVKAFAPELAKKGVRINLLAPGLIRTDFSAPLVENAEKRFAAGDDKAAGHYNVLGRVGESEEMGAVAAFLCSADASFMTGEVSLAAGGSNRL